MISTQEITLSYGKVPLFADVSVKFTDNNCYGLIGANGAGKSSFLKILAGTLEQSSGQVVVTTGERISVLEQDHFKYDDIDVLKTVIMGHKRLFKIMEEKDAIYSKPDFSDEDGIRVSELESDFADLNGWDAEPNAAVLLSGLGIPEALHSKQMRELAAGEKVRVLLAQALFGDPEILLLDEPTNHLDVQSILWLEEFLINFKNTVIVVSHDRHFLNKVCTHIADIDFQKLQLYTGNYEFWYQSRQLALSQGQDKNRRAEDKIKELKEFIARFSANASKSRQATSRKKALDKITLEEIKPSTRRYPHIVFKPEREAGKDLLRVENLGKNGSFSNLTFTIQRGERVAFVSHDGNALSAMFEVLGRAVEADTGELHWGSTTTVGYFPKENKQFFQVDVNLVDWLRQFTDVKDENFVRGFLGKMLFSGEESLKKCGVLSGGERVRCMLSRLMLQGPNVLVLDEPTNHLDLESITALNNSLLGFDGTLLFASHDVEFVRSLATRVIELKPNGFEDWRQTFDEYLQAQEQKQNQTMPK